MVEFYAELDKEMPTWSVVIRLPNFETWINTIDSNDRSCMFDRLYSLWGDPFDSAKEFSSLLRLFVRWNRDHHPTHLLRRCLNILRGLPKPTEDPALFPVLGGKYELLRSLGRGGCGEVYLAWSTETSSLYALKTIRSELALNPDARASFRHEAEAWIKLGEHPNIAKAFFFEEVGSRLYITMSFVECDDDQTGPSLADKLARGSLLISNIIIWFCHVADGLIHAYSHGIAAHRDIKPGNILIGRDGLARVSDFGQAVATKDLILAGIHEYSVSGTPLYMSPEQFVRSTLCNQQSDLYSIGITLYQAVSGRLPFVPKFTPRTNEQLAQFFSELRYLHEHSKPRPLTSQLWPVIEKCLQKSPSDRLSSMSEFRHALKLVADRLGVNTPEPAKVIEDFWFYRDQGNSLMRLGRYEEAISAFDSFLAVLETDESVIINRACCLQNIGKYAEACEVFQPRAERGDIAGLVNGSQCLIKLGHKDDAIAYAKRAVATDATDKSCWITLGNAQYALHNWDEAIGAYSRAQQLDPTDPTPAYNIGLAAIAQDSKEAARLAFLSFLRLSTPDDSRREYVKSRLLSIETA